MADLNQLKSLERDALKEIANIAAGNAATAVAQLIGAPLTVNVPTVSVIRSQDLPEPLGGPEAVVAGIYFRIFGDAPGKMLLCVAEPSIAPMVEMLMGSPPEPGKPLSDMQQSAIKELGNILCSAYLNAMARFMDMQLLPSTPAMAVDMISSVLSTVLAEAAEEHSQALLIETNFSARERPMTIHLFLIPEEGSLAAMLKALADATGLNPSGPEAPQD